MTPVFKPPQILHHIRVVFLGGMNKNEKSARSVHQQYVLSSGITQGMKVTSVTANLILTSSDVGSSGQWQRCHFILHGSR